MEGWTARPHPVAEDIVGRAVVVSPLVVSATEPLWEAFSHDDGSMWTYMGYGPFDSEEELSTLVERWVGATDPMFFTFDVGGAPMGWGSYLRIEPAMGSLEVGHLAFSPPLRRTTAATEAMYLMARRVFDDWGYRRYEWKCDDLNGPSRRAAERLGFTYEGTFRRHMVYKGRNRDTAWYSITDAEWPRIRAGFEQWLDPSNFEPDGRQRQTLAELRPACFRPAEACGTVAATDVESL